MMTNREAIEYLNDVRNGIHIPAPGIELPLLNDKEKEAIDLAIAALEKRQWIPCCERLPEESGKYIVTAFDGHKNRVAYVQYIRKIIGWWALSGQRTYWKVIAWMPLPEPYKAEDES